MKIFESWSGEDSRAVAELFKEWLRSVLQQVDVWLSSQDISKGDKWSSALSSSLSDHDFGILFITQANIGSSWIYFEAGALSKAVNSKVIPILCNLSMLDIGATPLMQMQCASISKEEIKSVVQAINRSCEKPLDSDRINAAFEKWWPDFEEQFQKIKFIEPDHQKAPVSELDRLANIEALVTTLAKNQNKLQSGFFLGNAPTFIGLRDEGTSSVRPDLLSAVKNILEATQKGTANDPTKAEE